MSSYQFNHPPHNRPSRPTLYRPCGGVFPGLVSCWWLTGWWVDVADARLLLYPTCNSILYKNHIYIALCANDWSDEGFTVFVRGNGAGRGITTSTHTHTTKCHAAPSIYQQDFGGISPVSYFFFGVPRHRGTCSSTAQIWLFHELITGCHTCYIHLRSSDSSRVLSTLPLKGCAMVVKEA